MFINVLNSASLCASLVKTNFYRTAHGKSTYYEILNLNQNCTKKEIRKAYIDLSKKYHPDKNANLDPKFFRELTDAYQTLSKKNTRREYDFRIANDNRQYRQGPYQESSSRRKMRSDAYSYRYKDECYDNCYDYHNDFPFHGTRRNQRLPKFLIIFGSLIIMSIAFLVQVIVIKNIMGAREKDIIRKNILVNQHLKKLQLPPDDDHNTQQLAVLKEKLRLNDTKCD